MQAYAMYAEPGALYASYHLLAIDKYPHVTFGDVCSSLEQRGQKLVIYVASTIAAPIAHAALSPTKDARAFKTKRKYAETEEDDCH